MHWRRGLASRSFVLLHDIMIRKICLPPTVLQWNVLIKNIIYCMSNMTKTWWVYQNRLNIAWSNSLLSSKVFFRWSDTLIGRTTVWASYKRGGYASLSLSLSLSLFYLSVSGRCCLDGSSIHQPIFCCSSHPPDTCPIQSSASFSQDLFGLPLFLWPFTFPSSINFSSVWCLFICSK